jgi:CheY-like chemotaxis protein
MKICLVEDDSYKSDDLMKVIESRCPNSTIRLATSYREASKVLSQEHWDCAVLDMQLPLFSERESDKLYAFGGERILRRLERMGAKIKVIVVTQFTTFSEHVDEVDFKSLVARLEKNCPKVFVGAVQYAIGQDDWQEELGELIKKIYNENTSC